MVENILTAHPDVNIIWAANEGGTVGAVTAVRNAGKAGQILVFGTDISEQMADFLLAEDGILQAVTGQKPFEIGDLAVQSALKALKGEKIEKKVSLPGILFTRAQPDEVKKYKQYLQERSK
jgi:ABC-type sugar transport system substrate-binding protein